MSFTWLALQGFGGVLAVVQRELVERKRWMSREEFVEDWAVAQILPGPNVVNLALIVGGRYFGLAGAMSAVAGMLVIPCMVVITLAVVYSTVAEQPLAQAALRGMGAVAGGLITATGLRLMSALENNAMGTTACGVVAVVTFAAVVVLRLPLAWVLLSVGTLACLWAYVQLGRQAEPGSGQGPS